MPRRRGSAAPAASALVFALPKGRILARLSGRLRDAGLDVSDLEAPDRRLVRDAAADGVRFLLLKPDDVPTYVEYGAADLGVVGRDVLLEREYDLYTPLDLGIGVCRMVVAGPAAARPPPGRALRVATKYPNVASRHFRARGEHAEIIYVQGSVELAPITGLADVIVDLVETGETLRQNGLVVLDTVCEVSSVVVANRVGLKLRRREVERVLSALARR